MTRRYFITYLAVVGIAIGGWFTFAGAQQPTPNKSNNVPRLVAPVEAKPLLGEKPSAVIDYSQPSARHEPSVRLEWTGPASIRVGQPNDFGLVVRNVGDVPVQQVMVRASLPPGWTLNAAEPQPVAEDRVLMWELGTMAPKQESNLRLRISSNDKGDFSPHAWVTFTGAASLRVKASEPILQVKVGGPQRCNIGDGAAFIITVSNPGDGAVERVRLTNILSAGLEANSGRRMDFDVGTLSPGESRQVQLLAVARVGGEQVCQATCEADGGLKACDRAVLNVVSPQLGVDISGPRQRYLDRKAAYAIRVSNSGDAPAAGVTIQNVIPAGFTFLAANHGGRFDSNTRTVSWFVGDVPAGASQSVGLEMVPTTPGEFTQSVQALAARGLKAESQITTSIEGLSAIRLQVVDLVDPVEVGGQTTYEIRITNTGSKTETDLKLICTLPEKMQLASVTGPTAHEVKGSELIFTQLPTLAPQAEAKYLVKVTAGSPGVVHFKSRITSTILVDPVHKEEATRIYAD